MLKPVVTAVLTKDEIAKLIEDEIASKYPKMAVKSIEFKKGDAHVNGELSSIYEETEVATTPAVDNIILTENTEEKAPTPLGTTSHADIFTSKT